MKIGARVDWEIELVDRTDLFEETHKDGIVRFGKKHLGKYLSETNRHWLAWVRITFQNRWPQELLDRVDLVGMRLSAGKDRPWEELVQEMQENLADANGQDWD